MARHAWFACSIGLLFTFPAALSAQTDIISLMTRMQRSLEQLGKATDAEDKTKYDSAMHELESTYNDLLKIPNAMGAAIGSNAKEHFGPAIQTMQKLDAGIDWDARKRKFNGLVHGCNACHKATNVSPIEISNSGSSVVF